MELKEMVRLTQEIDAQIADLKEKRDFVMDQIDDLVKVQVSAMRQMQDKEFGAVNFTVGDIKITHTIPKKVSWDQERMGIILQQIIESGDKPANYMRMKLEVPEKLYSDFGDAVKSIFAQARVVEPGKVTWKFEGVTNA